MFVATTSRVTLVEYALSADGPFEETLQGRVAHLVSEARGGLAIPWLSGARIALKHSGDFGGTVVYLCSLVADHQPGLSQDGPRGGSYMT